MGQIKTLLLDLQSIVFEAVDLFAHQIDVQCAGDNYFLTFESGEQVHICPTIGDSQRHKTGLHATGLDLDEYELCDLVERAIRGGFDVIFLHLDGLNGKAA